MRLHLHDNQFKLYVRFRGTYFYQQTYLQGQNSGELSTLICIVMTNFGSQKLKQLKTTELRSRNYSTPKALHLFTIRRIQQA